MSDLPPDELVLELDSQREASYRALHRAGLVMAGLFAMVGLVVGGEAGRRLGLGVPLGMAAAIIGYGLCRITNDVMVVDRRSRELLERVRQRGAGYDRALASLDEVYCTGLQAFSHEMLGRRVFLYRPVAITRDHRVIALGDLVTYQAAYERARQVGEAAGVFVHAVREGRSFGTIPGPDPARLELVDREPEVLQERFLWPYGLMLACSLLLLLAAAHSS